MCAGGAGSIPGADKLDFGFNPSGVSEMKSNYYVAGRLFSENWGGKVRIGREIVTCGISSRKRKLPPCGSLAVSAGTLQIAIVIKDALEMFWIYLYLFTFVVIKVRKSWVVLFAIGLSFFLK